MERTESEFIFAKFFDAYCEARSNTSSTLNLLAVYQLIYLLYNIDSRKIDFHNYLIFFEALLK